jgi:hypothetical protein
LAENAAQFEVGVAVFALEHGGLYLHSASFNRRLLPSTLSLYGTNYKKDATL